MFMNQFDVPPQQLAAAFLNQQTPETASKLSDANRAQLKPCAETALNSPSANNAPSIGDANFTFIVSRHDIQEIRRRTRRF